MSVSGRPPDDENDRWRLLSLGDVMLGLLIVAFIGIAAVRFRPLIAGGFGLAEIAGAAAVLAAIGAGVVFAVRRLSWKAGLLLCMVYAMLVTPADPTTMMLVGVPLFLVFAAARLTSRKRGDPE